MKTRFIDLPDELRNTFRRHVQQRDRFVYGVTQKQKRFLSRRKRRAFADQSLFKAFAPLWHQLTDEEKTTWNDAAAVSGITGWQLFISDNAARLRDDLPLEVPPSELWQVRAGRLLIEAPDDTLVLRQNHPLNYLAAPRVVGARWKRHIVSVREAFNFPLTLSIRYKSNLVPTGGAGPYEPPAANEADMSLGSFEPPVSNSVDFTFGSPPVARYYAVIVRSYQGKDSSHYAVIDFDAQSDWVDASVSFPQLYGIIISYTLYIEIRGYRGELLFDNIRAIHSGQNWVFDPRCDAIDMTFQKAFAAVPPYWEPVELPAGSQFYSAFPPSLS